jgi:hypothetical protein
LAVTIYDGGVVRELASEERERGVAPPSSAERSSILLRRLDAASADASKLVDLAVESATAWSPCPKASPVGS